MDKGNGINKVTALIWFNTGTVDPRSQYHRPLVNLGSYVLEDAPSVIEEG